MIEEIGKVTLNNGKSLLRMWKSSVEYYERRRSQHSHSQFEISLVLRGGGIYSTRKKEYTFSAGDVFVFSSNEQHYVTKLSQEGIVLLNIQFEPLYLMGRTPDSLSEENINFCFTHSPSFQNRIPAESSAEIKELMLKIKSEIEQSYPERNLLIKTYLNLILINLIRNFNYSDSSQPISQEHIKAIRGVMQYIDGHLYDPISLEEISDIACFTPNYFSTLFKSLCGISLWDYITSKRIEKSVKLLKNPANKNAILEIALKCGFNNTANFNKAFKKQMGTTPSEFRKNPIEL